MRPLNLIIIGLICLYIIIHFFLTQKIYSNNGFKSLLALSIFILLILLLSMNKSNRIEALNFALIFPYYTLILWTIKKTYNSLNRILIKKNIIDKKYSGKDFTYVLWDGDLPTIGNWWDSKLATKPSQLDHGLTICLIILPILLTLPVTTLI